MLDRHPDVVQSVVVARDDRGDTRLVAYAVLHHGADVTSDALRKHVAEVLPEAMVPSAVVRLDAFPLTPERQDRPQGAARRHRRRRAPTPRSPPRRRPTTPSASSPTSGAPSSSAPVGRDDNFFDIGGHSLLAVKVFRRLTDATGAPLALTDIFRFPTVRTFAAHLGTLQGGRPDSSSADAGGRRADRHRPRRDAPPGARRAAAVRRATG